MMNGLAGAITIGLGAMMLMQTAPLAAKTRRTLHTDDEVRQAREKVGKYGWARAELNQRQSAAAWLLEMSDEDLWDYIPGADLPRAYNVHFGSDCPVHGSEVNRKGGHYPWIISRDRPFKVECPVGHEVYPSNDFAADYQAGRTETLDVRREYVDDGWGHVDENGEKYWFVGYYVCWQLWQRDILPGVEALGAAYLLTGDSRYSHKAGVMLARIAEVYPDMDAKTQVVMIARLGFNGGVFDHHWEPGVANRLATAYDDIYDALDGDSALREFVASKGVADIKAHIETRLLQEMVRGTMVTGTIHGNEGQYQNALATLAGVLDNSDPDRGTTSSEMVEWILTGGGGIEELLWNGIYRDGHPGESAPSYSSGWFSSVYELGEKLERAGYDLFAHPKMKKMADIWIDLQIADGWTPDIGDCGDLFGTSRVGWHQKPYSRALLEYGDARYAKVLHSLGGTTETLFGESVDEQVAAIVERVGTDFGHRTRRLGGYGLAVLESEDRENPCGVSMYYGCASGGHGNWDRLNLELWAHGRVMMPEMGYPTPKGSDKEWGWTKNTISHYLVVVNQKRHDTMFAGRLNLLAASPTVQLMDASAPHAYPQDATLYRRTTVMIEGSGQPGQPYLVDIFRVKGGEQHDWSFHGPADAEFGIEGVALSPPQAEGTLAGAEVPFGESPKENPGSGFQYLFNARRGAPSGGWSALWSLAEDDVHLRMTMLPGCAQEVIAAEAEPELTPKNPATLNYVLARNRGDSLDSRYAVAIEPYKGTPLLDRVETLAVTDLEAPGARDVVAMKLAHGEVTDYVISALSGEARVTLDEGLELSGEFGMVSKDAAGVRTMFLVNGTLLRCGDVTLEAQPSATGHIVGIDFERNTITVDAALPTDGLSAGKLMMIGNDRHRTSYTIAGVERAGEHSVISLGDEIPQLAVGRVTAVDEAAGTVSTDTRLEGYGKVYGGMLDGMTLMNEARTAAYEIVSFAGGQFRLAEARDLAASFADANGDGQVRFRIHDFGVGDEFILPSTAYFSRD